MKAPSSEVCPAVAATGRAFVRRRSFAAAALATTRARFVSSAADAGCFRRRRRAVAGSTTIARFAAR